MVSLPDEVRQFCRNHGLRLNTDLGQHFLLDGSILDRIVESAKISSTDTIVEIGPGVGVLTRELLKVSGSVIAIELDERMIPLLKKFIGQSTDPQPRMTALTIVQGNALQTHMPETPYKVVANIPYHITSPLLRHLFLESKIPPASLTLLIQREVAERICDVKNAGMLTILVELFGTPRIVARVPPDAFLPPPKVDSAVLHIACFPTPLADAVTTGRLFKLTKIAFGQKRKMLRNTLGTFYGGLERLAGLGIAPTRRPQTLSVQEWIALAKVWPEHEDA
ncbi:MAG: 16S rRNA (adenine(1518)-N(6)/adenine(1519)-N(6))-dimethyltransferase RsmA [Candidatus Peribacteraceae bacterium]|nr:16S rRNA (adenine(1518)-N(6)/adenine(1519)-N(6))-dimethyltransferase RsmA [Candidatus Peribacteraceae bacterium]